MVLKLFLFFLLLSFLPALAFGEDDSSFPSGSSLLKDLGSPATSDANLILLTGAAASAASLWYESSTNYQLQKDVSTSKPLGSTSSFGDVMGQLVPNAVYAVGMGLDAWITQDSERERRDLSRMYFMLETSIYAGLVTDALKLGFAEPRPDNSDKMSFPSGHATDIFAFAGVVGLEHEWYYAVPAYALAGFVGFSRMNDNKHYLHDVIGGATVGLSYAYGIWYNREARSSLKASQLFILPTDDLQGSVLFWRTTL